MVAPLFSVSIEGEYHKLGKGSGLNGHFPACIHHDIFGYAKHQEAASIPFSHSAENDGQAIGDSISCSKIHRKTLGLSDCRQSCVQSKSVSISVSIVQLS